MTYKDRKQVKAGDGRKCRLSEHDDERLCVLVDALGSQASVLIRELVIEGLDRRGVRYSSMQQNIILDQRLEQLDIQDSIRALRREIDKQHLESNSGNIAVSH